MIRVVPDFYPEFACIASRCGHSCCVGWEVDVDEDSLERYSGIPGALGAKLRREIDMTSSPHFRLDGRERCPFLTEENLCQLILELGEDSLCQICTDHPRFRSWFPDRVEEGLGRCCEEAGRLLLDRAEPLGFLSLPFDGEDEEPGEDYRALRELRTQLISLLQDRTKTLKTRVCEAFSLCGENLPQRSLREDIDFLLTLEILEPEWRAALERLREDPQERWDADMERDGEHIMAYLLFRYFLSWGLERWDEGFALHFGAFTLHLLGALRGMTLREKGALTLADRVEWLRRWSAELEYSEDNLEALAEYL